MRKVKYTKNESVNASKLKGRKNQKRVVTGASLRAPIQRNSTYTYIFRRSIYETIRPEHPHQSDATYNAPRDLPVSWPCYMESCPFHGHATYMTTAASTAMYTSPCIFSAVVIAIIKLPRY